MNKILNNLLNFQFFSFMVYVYIYLITDNLGNDLYLIFNFLLNRRKNWCTDDFINDYKKVSIYITVKDY